MRQLVPVCPFLLENNSSGKIFFSYRGVADYYPLHGHDYYELELIVQGCGRQWINNVCVPMRQGSLYLLTPSDIHRVEADEPLHVLSIHYLPEIAAQIDFDQVQEAYSMELAPQDFELFRPLAFSVLAEGEQSLPYSTQRMLSVTMLMLAHLLRNGTKYAAAVSSRHMQQALNFIHQNHANPNLRLKDAAEVCGLSTCYFSTAFRNAVGCGFSEYLLSYRLHRACILLSDVNVTASEAAYEVGFASLSHFFRVFREVYHCTPRQYRQRALASAAAPDHPRWEFSISPAPSLM